jgi:hypothetical protein
MRDGRMALPVLLLIGNKISRAGCFRASFRASLLAVYLNKILVQVVLAQTHL